MSLDAQSAPVATARLVAEVADDYRNRLRHGEQPDVEAYARRYPHIAEALREVLPALSVMNEVQEDLVPDDASDPVGPDARTLGDFRIQREIGRGGMGVVYEAEQISLGRRVALKVLPYASVMDPRHLQRFKNEAQAAAHLHHSHIVPVHAVGCERGVHYYAMQYVEGLSLAEIIRELRAGERRSGNGRQRRSSCSAATRALTKGQTSRSATYCRNVVRLGIQAARALDHAHQQGVVHRDVKPANLIVDAGGHLWIMDFGLASFQNNPALTRTGDLIGTVRYMSPEQTRARSAPLDHRTDVYSLGVTLYELLTLRHAYLGKDAHRIVQEIALTDPRPPRQLNPAVPTALETILMKAMAKRADQRYETARAFAGDLNRFLAHEPIHATRPTLVQRAGTWARRHATLVWAAAAVLLLAVLSSASAATLIWREKSRAEAAYESEARQRERAETNLGLATRNMELATQNMALATRNMELAMAALDEIYVDEAAGMPKLRANLARDLLERGLRFYESFAEQNADNPTAAFWVAAAYIRAGLIYEGLGRSELAAQAFATAIAKSREVVRTDPDCSANYTLLGSALGNGGRLEEALAAYREAIRLDPANAIGHTGVGAMLGESGHWQEAIAAHREAIRRDPSNATAHYNLAVNLQRRGRNGEALAAYRESIRLRPDYAPAHGGLGTAFHDEGRYEEAIGAYREAIRLDPDEATAHCRLGATLHMSGQLEEAVAAHREAIRLQPDQPLAWTDLGLALDEQGRFEDALDAHRMAIELAPDGAHSHFGLGAALVRLGRSEEATVACREAIRLDPELADAWSNLGVALGMQGRYEEAVAACREAIRLEPGLVDPHTNLGDVLNQQGRFQEAVAPCREAIRLDPHCVKALNNLGIALMGTGRHDEAVAAFREAIRLDPDYALAHVNLGALLGLRGRYEEAVGALREAVRLDPERAEAYGNLGMALKKLGRLDEALEAIRAAIRLQPDRAMPHLLLGSTSCMQGRYEEAVAAFLEALRLDEDDPRVLNALAWFRATCPDPRFRNAEVAISLAERATSGGRVTSNFYNTLGVAYYRGGRWRKAVAALLESVGGRHGSDAFVMLPSGAPLYDYVFLAMAYWQIGEADEARNWYEKTVEGMEKLTDDDPELRRFCEEAAELLGADMED